MKESDREAAAREALDRVRRDAGRPGDDALGRAARRMGDHFAGRDAPAAGPDGAPDPVEVWGRRIGRILSVLLAGFLVWWLGAQLGWF